MGNRIDKLANNSTSNQFQIPFTKLWLSLYDLETVQKQKNHSPCLHTSLSQCLENLTQHFPIPEDYPADTFGGRLRLNLIQFLGRLNAKQLNDDSNSEQPINDVDLNSNQSPNISINDDFLKLKPNKILLDSNESFDRVNQLLKSVPIINMRAHLNDYEITNQMIYDCFIYFRQSNHSSIQKYGLNLAEPIILDAKTKLFYTTQQIEALFQLFIDLDSPERSHEYYALHFIHESGYELHIDRVQSELRKLNPEKLNNFLIVPSDVNYERGSQLSKTLRNHITQPSMNLNTQKILFVTIQGTRHNTDYQLWKSNQLSRPLPQVKPPVESQIEPQSDPNKIEFLIIR